MRAHEGMWLRLRLLHTREHGVWHTSTRQAGLKYEAGCVRLEDWGGSRSAGCMELWRRCVLIGSAIKALAK